VTDPNTDPHAAALEQAFLLREGVISERKRLAPKVKALAEAMADMRLTVLALTHDLESTRRERDSYRAQLGL
jgi:hypothetical protein